MLNQRFLTKSRFKLACECPTKLFYANKRQYADQKIENPFLEALAQGGYQIGELAKLMHPDGKNISTLVPQQALKETDHLLLRDNVTIFEAAVRHENLLVRVDILIKRGDILEVVEVKAKSMNPALGIEQFLTNKAGTPKTEWRPILEDVAFQKWVVKKACPNASVSASLMLVDKTSVCEIDGLNQKFKITRTVNGSHFTKVDPKLKSSDLKQPLLAKINVDEICDRLWDEVSSVDERQLSFEEKIRYFARRFANDEKISPQLGPHCKHCQFRTSKATETTDLLSGFKECWSEKLGWKEEDFDAPTILEIWNNTRKQYFFDEGRLKIEEVEMEDLAVTPSDQPGLSRSERQWEQVKRVKERDATVYIDMSGLRQEMATWRYPLNFIDFETAQPALPFSAGMSPYEQISFQFSHHLLHEDGRVEHAAEFLEEKEGVFPSFNFLRSLKLSLESNNGTIFRYGSHENTYLNRIEDQLLASDEMDKDELIAFVHKVTHRKEENESSGAKTRRSGPRDMVDLIELVKCFYYAPQMKGSNSIKAVLPAVLNNSAYLQRKYSQPIYGTSAIPSRNFRNKRWIQFSDQDKTVIDPYLQLPDLFRDIDSTELELDDLLSDDRRLKDGGAAMIAYSRLQFESMKQYERQKLIAGLKRYCELDTLAMAMIVEAWIHECR